jgi:HK97 gp10 family phage protein
MASKESFKGKNLRITTSGDELDEALGKIALQLRTKVAKKAVRKAGGLVRTEMRRLAPRKTGELRKSIKLVVRDYDTYTLALVGPADVDERQAKKNNALEYGSDERNIRPHGFVRGAGDNTKEQVEAAIIAAIQAEIGK